MVLRRIFDDEFQTAVGRLRVAGAGTEAVAPLLAALVGMVRPRRVLEVGMGYTTPFLAAALAAVQEQSSAESAALAAKTRRHLAGGGDLQDSWLFGDPPLVSPEFHLSSYLPCLVAVDNLSLAGSSAGQVADVLAELHLDHLVTVVNRDLHEAVEALPAHCTPIDFAWVDAWECLYFFDHYWELINPDGGLVAMHYLLTYPEGEAVLRYLKKFQQAHPTEVEITSLLEPHKLMQNSVTLLRRTSGLVNRDHVGTAGHVRYTEALTRAAGTHARMATESSNTPAIAGSDQR